jgi:hypothetical protein
MIEPGAENSTSDVSLYCTFKPKGDAINVAKTACGFQDLLTDMRE